MSAAEFCMTCGAKGVVGQRFCTACGAAIQDPADSRVGTTLGQYRVERVIARGGMGVVYQAYDSRLERNVALKLLREDFASDPDFRERFLRESRAAAGLDHQNILPVFDAGEADGVLYIATRLVTGVDLRHHLAQEGTLTLDRAVSIVGQVGWALDFAHSRGLVHRDVKPANILLVAGEHGEDDHAYLIDFGITKRAESDIGLTATGHFVGTPEYVAPEQIDSRPLDGRADQYALACVLFHCLTGRSPFAGDTTVDILHAHMHTEPPRASDGRAGLPPSVDAAITRALSKNPARRFQTCRAFVAAARAGTGLVTPVSTPAPTVHTAGPPALPAPAAPAGDGSGGGRRASRTALVAGLLVALAGAGVGAGALIGGTGKRDQLAGGPAAAGGGGPAVTTITAPSTTTPPTTPTTSTQTTAPPVITTPVPSLDAAGVVLESHSLAGYDVGLPAGWKLKLDDVPQDTAGDGTRRSTKVSDSSLGATVLIDHSDHFSRTARENRASLDASYAEGKPGYRLVGFDEYEIGGLTAVEWRYSLALDGTRTARRVDVMFGRPPELFAVLTGGRASYDDLALLARRVAESITVTGAPPSPQPVTTVSGGQPPTTGTYTGLGKESGASRDDYRIEMTFAAGAATIDYPDLGCSGTLDADGFGGGGRVYRERITSGPCDRGGTWNVHVVSAASLTATWSKPGGRFTVTARLSR
jgi:nitrogen fixation protein